MHDICMSINFNFDDEFNLKLLLFLNFFSKHFKAEI